MYKFAPLLLSVTFLMTGCSGSDKSVEALKSMELNQENMHTIKELREDNARLQEQIAQIQENVHSEELRNNLRETLNMTFKLKDSDHFMLFIAKYITTKGSEGNIAYEFSFVRSPEGVWLFDGYVS
ncbi:hypothetical protein B2I21_25785 [Chryseobacterium mucoviscidosis]|uniref:hypothetical protein n=1 Tax=unclassified Paenibacillus TaxID=185978 RepID=UPI0009A2E23E|nr:hypothetical protein [Paenibacillus sp. 11B]MDN8591554.1 hypothetical protein [Paenibacillus sp. 11B]OPG95485.1 hypothetical protein B2I21_25785 [Chryseobacterium mucoviscidosis]